MKDPTILYVEDDPLSCMVMEGLLKRHLGFRNVTIFENSDHFLERLQQIDPLPDVVFLDIHMEPLDGFDMLRLIRNEPSLDSLKVVAVTASVMNEEVKRLKDAGFNSVLAKPLDVERFPEALNRILDGEQIWIIK